MVSFGALTLIGAIVVAVLVSSWLVDFLNPGWKTKLVHAALAVAFVLTGRFWIEFSTAADTFWGTTVQSVQTAAQNHRNAQQQPSAALYEEPQPTPAATQVQTVATHTPPDASFIVRKDGKVDVTDAHPEEGKYLVIEFKDGERKTLTKHTNSLNDSAPDKPITAWYVDENGKSISYPTEIDAVSPSA
ncbi:MAG: hypothetical protein ABIH58_05560 [Patescibacteria group bacterium]